MRVVVLYLESDAQCFIRRAIALRPDFFLMNLIFCSVCDKPHSTYKSPSTYKLFSTYKP